MILFACGIDEPHRAGPRDAMIVAAELHRQLEVPGATPGDGLAPNGSDSFTIDDARAWFGMRKLLNQVIHEYTEDLTVLALALQAGHGSVPARVAAMTRLIQP
jgi:hypothetical protein